MRSSASVLVLLAASALVSIASCAKTEVTIGDYRDDDAGAAPSATSFTPPDSDASAADASTSVTRQLCIATTCPYPYATCESGYACSTNLSNDSQNCGACGNACPSDFGSLNMRSTCIDGECKPTCVNQPTLGGFNAFADCNGILDDGCEVMVSSDPNNCGACGNVCPPGVACRQGKCGCPAGQTECNGQCVDLQKDGNNCGACGNQCPFPDDLPPAPPHSEYGCVSGACGKLKCTQGFGDIWRDCDGDLNSGPGSNGCEVNVGVNYPRDPNNCGACGNKCAPGKLCYDIDGDRVPECICERANETLCGDTSHYNLGCYDLLNDPNNCGTCFNRCRADEPNTVAACRQGLCEAACAPGWGDCDGDPNTGCETNLKASGANCGACGKRCDTQAGQPCVDGQCAMTDCDGGVVH